MTNNTMAKIRTGLNRLRCPALLTALKGQLEDDSKYADVPFLERLDSLVSSAVELADSKRMERLVKAAHAAHSTACFEEISSVPGRTLDMRLLNQLKGSAWVKEKYNVIVMGAAGAGKSFIASVLTHDACAQGYKSRYATLNEVLDALDLAERKDCRYLELKQWSSWPLLVLDDFLLTDLTQSNVRHLFELVQSRHGEKATVFCSHYSLEGWHERLGAGPLADSILDRIVHRGYRVEIKGTVSMREKFEGLPANSGLPATV